jgi:hypothetical protein
MTADNLSAALKRRNLSSMVSLRGFIVMFVIVPVCVYAQTGTQKTVQEVGVSYGETFRPKHEPTVIADYSVGRGGNAVDFQVAGTYFGNHPIGVGPFAGVPDSNDAYFQGSTSGAKLFDVSANYQRDLYRRNRFTVYAGAGVGYFCSSFNSERSA